MPILFDNTNASAVQNGPSASTIFTLNSPALITLLDDYHWNNGGGALPGAISLEGRNGQMFGPFQAYGTWGQNNAPFVNWLAPVSLILPAGAYTIHDSDHASWSQNAQSGGRGFAKVIGSQGPLPLPPPVIELFNNTNILAVSNGPTRNKTGFTLNYATTIVEITTYHWNNGHGAAPGTISLRAFNGKTFGPFAALGTPGSGGVANANWVASLTLPLPAGTYVVDDSDNATWSQNALSDHSGFAIVRGW